VDAVVSRISLRVHGARSLKDKRARIRPVIDRIRHRHHLSVSEVGYQDDLRRAEIGIAVVAPTVGRAEELLGAAEDVVHAAADLEVLDLQRTWFETD
jgi:uncharacterized protein YlxP (DUF503 family)